MKTLISGQNYNFCTVANESQFYIEAIHLASLRSSFINNLNAVLSEFDIDIDDEKVSESQWLVSKNQSRVFFKKAKGFLLNKHHRDFIERQLDKDRQCGEWENFSKES